MTNQTVTFESLIGPHMLDGVDFSTGSVKQDWGDGFEDCQVMRFRLDGIVYAAIEDPSDGYRSTMRELVVSSAPMKNTFAPIAVECRMRASEEYQVDEVMEAVTPDGVALLEFGTANTDDYYPYYVANWNPPKATTAPAQGGG